MKHLKEAIVAEENYNDDTKNPGGGDYVLGSTDHPTNMQQSHHPEINEQFNETNPRLSRTTPVANADAVIPIDSTNGCSCFGWFGRKKTKVGLAQQELR